MQRARSLLILSLLGCLISGPHCPASLAANSSDDVLNKGSSEWGVQGGGGFSVAGGVPHESYAMLLGRWGKILTPSIGKGPLKGNLQYSIELIPVMLVSQSSLAYAAGLSPLQLRYNFTSSRVVIPFFEIGGAVLFSSKKVPEDTSHINFLTFGGTGIRLHGAKKTEVQMGMRFQHISNAGMADLNPGINSLYFFLGLSRLK